MSSERLSPSGIPIPAVVRPDDVEIDYASSLGDPGQYPYTRGVQPSMYRGRLWTMRQYAGFGTARATNERFRLLLDAGQTGLSVAFDLPTQMGIDSDSPRALGEVGRVGVALQRRLELQPRVHVSRLLFLYGPVLELSEYLLATSDAAA